MTESNGHAPDVLDLGDVLERTRPRVLRLPAGALRQDSLTVYELVSIGRVLELEPGPLVAMLQATLAKRGGWESIELMQAIAWTIARRVEPALTWEQAQTFALELPELPPEDPTAAAGPKRSRRPGTSGASKSTERPGSRPTRRGR